MVGRDAELDELGAGLDRAREGTPGVILVVGEAGIGKTRLLYEAAGKARSAGASVLIGTSGPYAYGPLIGILRELRRELGDHRLLRMLTGVRQPLTRLVPGLEPGGGSGTEVGAQAPLFEAVLDLLDELSDDAPLLVGVEDLHQADESTLDLITFLTTNLTTERMLLIATSRTGDVDHHRIGGFLAEIVRHPTVRRLDLSPLSDGDVTRLLAAIQNDRPSEEAAVRIARRSQGNPFYLEELLAAGPGEVAVPHGLEDLIVARLAGLDPETRELLRAAAVLGSRPHDRLLHEISDLSDTELRAALQEAVDQALLIPEGDVSERYRFRHDLIREVLHRRLLVDQRQRLHAAAARHLEADPELATGGADHVHAQLGRHWHLAGQPDRAFEASLAASDEAMSVHARSEALAHLERALSLWKRIRPETRREYGPRYVLEQRCVEIGTVLGDPETILEHLDAALKEEAVPDPTRALLHSHRADCLHGLGRHDESEAAATRALDLLPENPSHERAEVLARLAGRCLVEGRGRECVRYSREAVDIAREIGAPTIEALALNWLGCGRHTLGHPDEGIDHLREALAIARDVGDTEETKRAYINLSAMLRRSGRFDEAVELTGEALQWCSERGIGASNREWLQLIQATALMQAGRWIEAERALSLLRSISRRLVVADVFEVHVTARLRARQGRLEEVHRLLDRIPPELVAGLAPQQRAPLLEVQAVLALAEGRLDDVRDIAEQAARAGRGIVDEQDRATYEAALFLDRPLAVGIRAEAEQARRARQHGDDDAIMDARGVAEAFLEALRDAAGRAPDGTFVGTCLDASFALGEAELARLDDEPAPDAWRAAVDAEQATGMPHREAYARFRLAEALLEEGGRDEAAEELEEADRVAKTLGAGPLRQQIASLARRGRLGLEAAHRDDELGSDLTPREIDVLELLVEGRTNRQIGEALYVTEKTVERHVTSILSKLQVDNRTEAAAVVRRRQLLVAG